MSRGHPVPFPALPVQASVSDPHNPDMAQRGHSSLSPPFFQEEFKIQVMNQERVQITTIEERLTSESWTVTFQTRPGGPVGAGRGVPRVSCTRSGLGSQGQVSQSRVSGTLPSEETATPKEGLCSA